LNKWFKKAPYLGWLAIFAVSLLACIFLYQWEKKKYKAEQLLSYVQQDFTRNEQAIAKDFKAGLFPRFLKADDRPQLSGDYFVFLTEGESALYWNTTMVDLPHEVKRAPAAYRNGKLEKLSTGYYYIRSWQLPAVPGMADSLRIHAFTLIPVVYAYDIENQYFQSRFAADPRVPVSTGVSAGYVKGSYAVRSGNGKAVFYLRFTEGPDQIFVVSTWVWVLTLIAFLSLAFWVHETCQGIGLRSGKPVIGWLVLALVISFVYYFRNEFTYPSGFLNSKICSPELLSSGESVRSLGDFIMGTLLALWLFLYLLIYVPIAANKIVKHNIADKLIRLMFVFGLVLILYRQLAVDMITLVIDSKISFEVSDFSSLTLYTFIGIFTLSIITINFLVILGIINAMLSRVVKQLLLKYGLVAGVSLLIIYLQSGMENGVFNAAILIMSIAGLLLIDAFGMPFQKSPRLYDLSIAPTSYLWFAILCSWITLEIFYLNYTKEKELRMVFAQKQQQKDDAYVEYAFMGQASAMQQDTLIQAFFKSGADNTAHAAIDKYIFYNFLTEYARRYSIDIYYYDALRRPLNSKDSADMQLMRLADSLFGKRFVYGVQNVEYATKSNHMFWLLCPIPDLKTADTLGYVGIDISVDKAPKIISRRSFLEKKYNPTDQLYFDKYAYGIYRNNTLWTQGGNHFFPHVNRAGKDTSEFRFLESWNTSQLLYRPTPEELIKVTYDRNLLTNIISLFSYVLAVLLVLTGSTFVIRQVFFYPVQTRFFLRNFNFTIRSKVNLTILTTVFASLLVVGIVTLSFLNNKYKENQRRNLQNLLLYYTQNILHFTAEHPIDFSQKSGAAYSGYSDLSYQLNGLAEDQGADINLYNASGKLIATSQLELVRQGLLSKHMQPKVFDSMRHGDQYELLVEEKVGDLSYQSIYAPLRSKNDKILAYVNLPYYASQAELNDERSNVLVSLINVYALIFFLSGICAILISNSIIRSFRLLIDQFRNIRLRHNEYIEWPYKDEIGILVGEYNTMMRKVEAMASKLARTERETAWREIARQVAHEIKNPLTPMKLNIQYLQQAIKTGRTDIHALTLRVSDTLIEQIENLNLIATEFSNFAKMPEANPEILNVTQSLHSLVTLFQKDDRIKVRLVQGVPDLYVDMDKSYFIRIFTNLIQNAIQAIDADKEGLVEISYEQKDNDVVIEVKDNGSGFPEEVQEKLFVPYFTTKSSGTGLGLSMTRSMVEHSNGTIRFTTVMGEGSSFYVSLPLVQGNTG
jgi:signal transduction histidine kinase